MSFLFFTFPFLVLWSSMNDYRVRYFLLMVMWKMSTLHVMSWSKVVVCPLSPICHSIAILFLEMSLRIDISEFDVYYTFHIAPVVWFAYRSPGLCLESYNKHTNHCYFPSDIYVIYWNIETRGKAKGKNFRAVWVQMFINLDLWKISFVVQKYCHELSCCSLTFSITFGY